MGKSNSTEYLFEIHHLPSISSICLPFEATIGPLSAPREQFWVGAMMLLWPTFRRVKHLRMRQTARRSTTLHRRPNIPKSVGPTGKGSVGWFDLLNIDWCFTSLRQGVLSLDCGSGRYDRSLQTRTEHLRERPISLHPSYRILFGCSRSLGEEKYPTHCAYRESCDRSNLILEL